MPQLGIISIVAGLLLIYIGFNGATFGEVMKTIFGP